MGQYGNQREQASADESTVNIQYGWAIEICKTISEMNLFSKFCNQGEYSCLNNYMSTLIILYNHIYSRIDDADHGPLQDNFKECKQLWEKFKRSAMSFGLIGEAKKKKNR